MSETFPVPETATLTDLNLSTSYLGYRGQSSHIGNRNITRQLSNVN